MEAFSLQDFVLNPTLEQLNICRKQDLLMVADHYQIVVNKQSRKAEIKDRILLRLHEKNILPSSSAGDETAENVGPEDGAIANPSHGTEEDLLSGQASADAEAKAKAGLPLFDPLSPISSSSRGDARLKVRLARLQYEAQEKAQARQAELNMRLEIRKLEIEAEKEVKLRQLDLEALRVTSSSAAQLSPALASDVSPPIDPSQSMFDISKHIALLPQFRESEVDSYFCAFERIATSLRWPKEVWSLLLQCKLFGKAQEVCSTLSVEDSLNYESVKSAILLSYELVPEAYRQRFRGHKKNSTQTFVEFEREKGILFDKWCTASKMTDFNSLRELMLLEDFKSCLPERVVVYLNEQKVSSLSHAAVLADEFVLTHKNVFTPTRLEKTQSAPYAQANRSKSTPAREERECFYCHKKGHVIADCSVLKRKQHPQAKSVGFLKTQTTVNTADKRIDDSYRPFILAGLISLSGSPEDQIKVKMLRDTGAMQSFIVADKLQLSDDTFCGSSVIVQGIEMSCIKAPLHCIHLQSDLCTGFVRVAVRPSLPVKGVDFILGNDLAGGKVMPVLEVVDKPNLYCHSDLSDTHSNVFPACAVTRAQACKFGDVVELSNSFFSPLLAGQKPVNNEMSLEKQVVTESPVNVAESDMLQLPVS
ncbi:uncharacterized protein LOC131362376 [Hemibagrus wyckioides]|uniref:uncharacterized protein LOC131362376 n=1 Tax=Hemibagrus wyckioides TaxID=337641 RepID=UPI00266D978C|nr:uncharacterized protein LOC131362376 [Hemibagrus wyckioides]